MRGMMLAASLSCIFFVSAGDVTAELNPFKKTDKEKTADVEEAIKRFRAKDTSIGEFFKKAEGYAVFPNVGKGGMGIGGAYGKGQLYQSGKLIGKTTLKQASIGFQLGGQTYSEIIFFETTKALEKFKSGKFELGAQVSAVAITAGAAAGAQFNNGIAVFTMTKKGLMYEAAVAGQRFTFKPKE